MNLLYILVLIPVVSGHRTVMTNSGPIRGTSVAGKKVTAFLGIPYAESPVGQLRFARPVPKSSWQDTYEANELPASCMQIRFSSYFGPNPDGKFSEDCLYLNLWVPDRGSNRKAVMIFIYGGSLLIGSSNMELYNGAKLAEQGDVIVATMNYRLASLGFFSAFTDEAEGSMGLLDQIMAVQWIKDNAKHFRGDPDSITLMGESSGSFSVSLHMVSPLSKNLFRRGIMQSGTAFIPIFDDDNQAVFETSQRIASVLGCAEDEESLKKNPKGVVECLRKVPAENFTESDVAVLTAQGSFRPVVGGDFLPRNPLDLLKEGDFTDKEVLLGVTRDEGSILLTNEIPDILGTRGEKAESVDFNETSATEIMRNILRPWKLDKEEGIDKILRGYLERVETEKGYTYLDALSQFIGDLVIVCSNVFEADYLSLNNALVYFYLFDYRPPSSVLAKWMGVAHFDELQYVFGNPMYANFTNFEKKFSKYVMNKWTVFAKTGNPNVRGDIKWPQYTSENPNYFRIKRRSCIGVNPDNYRCDAWRKLYQAEIDD